MENRLDLILETLEKAAKKLDKIESKQDLYYDKLDLELTFIKKILLVMDDTRRKENQQLYQIIEKLNELIDKKQKI